MSDLDALAKGDPSSAAARNAMSDLQSLFADASLEPTMFDKDPSALDEMAGMLLPSDRHSSNSSSSQSSGSGDGSGGGVGMGSGPAANNTTPELLKKLQDPTWNPTPPAGTTYSTQSNFQLYPQGEPKASDIFQTEVGDCDVESTFAEMANQNPDKVKSMIHDNKDGTYTVDMFDPTGKPIKVTVNDQLPVDNKNGYLAGNMAPMDPHHGNWASIMEKAYAKYQEAYNYPNSKEKGYAALTNGGMPDAVYQAFTGKGSDYTTPSANGGLDKEGQDMQNALKSGHLIVSGISTHGAVTLSSGAKIDAGHAYAVLDVNKDSNGNWYVDVRNPWGSTDGVNGSGPNNDDGVTRMSLDEYNKVFDGQETSQATFGSTGSNKWDGKTTSDSQKTDYTGTNSGSSDSGGVSQSQRDSLTSQFNSDAAQMSADQWKSNINDGWNHIQNDMKDNNTKNLQEDLQWMMGQIVGYSSFSDSEKAVIDDLNNIAKAYGLTLDQPQPIAVSPLLTRG